MALAVHEALKLEALNRFKLVAGLNGLDRNISRAGIIDHEENEAVRETTYVGEFIISNFLIIRDKPELIVEYVKHLIAAQAACLAIKMIYFKEVPQEAIDLANEYQFPIFLFDETHIDIIIIEIDKAINIQGYQQRTRVMVDQIIDTNLSEFRIRELAREINRNFKNHFIVYFTRINQKKKDDGMGLFSPANLSQFLGDSSLVIHYREGYLIIATYKNEDHKVIQEFTDSAIKTAGLTENNYRIGQSEVKEDLGELGRAISESIYAHEYASLYDLNQSNFSDMGVYKLLMPLVNDPWVRSFYKDLLSKLVEYDKQHGTALLDTAIRYVECGGDIQQTSTELFQHANTVRYRVRKITSILGFEDIKGMAYESLAMAIRLYLITI